MKYDLECHYIGVMYPDYLQDHHCREGEVLISASVGPDVTNRHVCLELIEAALAVDSIPDEIDDDAIRSAIVTMWINAPDDTPFDANIPPEDVCNLPPYIWAYLKWTPVE